MGLGGIEPPTSALSACQGGVSATTYGAKVQFVDSCEHPNQTLNVDIQTRP